MVCTSWAFEVARYASQPASQPATRRLTGLFYPRLLPASQPPSQALYVLRGPRALAACSIRYIVVVRGGFLWGSTQKSVWSLPRRKYSCGVPPGKCMTGLFCPRTASLSLSGPLWASASQPKSKFPDFDSRPLCVCKALKDTTLRKLLLCKSRVF